MTILEKKKYQCVCHQYCACIEDIVKSADFTMSTYICRGKFSEAFSEFSVLLAKFETTISIGTLSK